MVQTADLRQLSPLSFTVNRGEIWSITGSSGSGKTLIARAIAGKQAYHGQMHFYFPPKRNNRSTIHLVEQQHHFKSLNNVSNLYYQQRFNSQDADQTRTVREELKQVSGEVLDSGHPTLALLNAAELLDEPLIQLSNGENKRIQLVSALLADPELIVMDNPFVGLDADGRKILHSLIEKISNTGVQVILITTNDEIAEYITHILWLENGQIAYVGPRTGFSHPYDYKKAVKAINPGKFDQLPQTIWPDFDIAVRMINVHVSYGEKKILDEINWEVQKGEHWSLSGPNGAGKSTLLSLISADHPQAYANEIYLFDRRRGSGESIWDIKKNIGFVSPELHLYFDAGFSCFDVVASGLFDTIGLFRKLSSAEQSRVLYWIDLFNLEQIQTKPFFRLAVSEQKEALLARALIKNPPMLILDEPCQGLDEWQSQYFCQLVDLYCRRFQTTLIYVSHYAHQVPKCVDHFLSLRHGKTDHAG
ncbi:MAG TPA: ATP-binding cassette domain-containing protein [Puia sp.]|nr:ATP-binding cassette domain-containing protein [Puia sp.]